MNYESWFLTGEHLRKNDIWVLTKEYFNLKHEAGFYWVFRYDGHKLIYPAGKDLKKSFLEVAEKSREDREKVERLLEMRK